MVEYIECSIILQWNEGLLYPIILSQTGVFHYIIDTYNQAQTKNCESHKSWHALVYAQNGKLEFLIAAFFAIVYDYKGHRRDIVWYFQKPNRSYIKLLAKYHYGYYT